MSTLTARQRRAAYSTLSRDRLAELTDEYELEVADRRVVQNHVDALVRARRVAFADVLSSLTRNELEGHMRRARPR